MARWPRRLLWEPGALASLEELADHMPAAARDALDAMDRMASTGFNYGRLTVVDVVDARRLRELP